jgi:hypothetical protein
MRGAWRRGYKRKRGDTQHTQHIHTHTHTHTHTLTPIIEGADVAFVEVGYFATIVVHGEPWCVWWRRRKRRLV